MIGYRIFFGGIKHDIFLHIPSLKCYYLKLQRIIHAHSFPQISLRTPQYHTRGNQGARDDVKETYSAKHKYVIKKISIAHDNMERMIVLTMTTT